MTAAISLIDVGRRYRDQEALAGVTVDVETPSIVGLLGRNGAGKSTLLRILAGQEFATTGRARVFGREPATSDDVLRRMILVREDQIYPDLRIRDVLAAASLLYPHWDAGLAAELTASFELPSSRPVKKLSRGMRSAVGIVIGLSVRAELTLFDEPCAGLDPVARELFYRHLLADYTEHPRCIVVSTHLIDEAAELLERVLVIDHGRLVLDALTDDLRGSAVIVTGPTNSVHRFIADRPTLSRRELGRQTTAVMAGRPDARDRELAARLHLSLDGLTLQQLTVHLSEHHDRLDLAPTGTD